MPVHSCNGGPGRKRGGQEEGREGEGEREGEEEGGRGRGRRGRGREREREEEGSENARSSLVQARLDGSV